MREIFFREKKSNNKSLGGRIYLHFLYARNSFHCYMLKRRNFSYLLSQQSCSIIDHLVI